VTARITSRRARATTGEEPATVSATFFGGADTDALADADADALADALADA